MEKSRSAFRFTSNTGRQAGSGCAFARRRNWNRSTDVSTSCALRHTTAYRKSGAGPWAAPWFMFRVSWSGCVRELAGARIVCEEKKLMDSQADKAMQFRQRHRGPGALVLPNAWDVASARVFEEAGFPAIATTSAGIAFSLGYPDGERIPREEMFARIARIARAIKVPVSADIEAGYGSTPEDAARTTRELIQAGAIGMNLEDTSGDPAHPLLDVALAVEKIKAARAAAVEF